MGNNAVVPNSILFVLCATVFAHVCCVYGHVSLCFCTHVLEVCNLCIFVHGVLTNKLDATKSKKKKNLPICLCNH